MSDLNSVSLIGRLTADPDVRMTQNGDSVVNIRLAVNARRSGENIPNFFDVTFFGKVGSEVVAKYCGKGSKIGVTGKLQWREWEAKDGTKRQSVSILGNDVSLIDTRKDGQATEAPAEEELPF